jgi:hypothetical protein
VRKEDLLHVQELLISQGYQLSLTETQAKAFLKDRYHYPFVREDGWIDVEVHWAFTRRYWPFPLDLERLWDRLEEVPLTDHAVFSFHPEDLLLILCVHGAKHHWRQFRWVCDVAELIRTHKGIDWERVIAQATTLGCVRVLFLGLLLARNLLRVPLPDDVLQRIQAEPAVESLATRVYTWSFSEKHEAFADVDDPVFALKMRERPQDRISFLLHYLGRCLHKVTALNARDQEILSLPSSLSFLYYLLRPLRLVGKYGLGPLKPLLKYFALPSSDRS